MLGTTVDTVPARYRASVRIPGRLPGGVAGIGPGGFKIGSLGREAHQHGDLRRSVALANYALVAAVPGVRMISVQGVNGLEQLKTLPPAMTVEGLGRKITDNPEEGFPRWRLPSPMSTSLFRRTP